MGDAPRKIAETLTSEGIPSPLNGEKWYSSTIENILSNEKYKGAYMFQKYYTKDFLSHKAVQNKGERDKIYHEDSHEPIIPKEVWAFVENEMYRRGKEMLITRPDNEFSGKVYWSGEGGLVKMRKYDDIYRSKGALVTQNELKDAVEKAFSLVNVPNIGEARIKTAQIDGRIEAGAEGLEAERHYWAEIAVHGRLLKDYISAKNTYPGLEEKGQAGQSENAEEKNTKEKDAKEKSTEDAEPCSDFDDFFNRTWTANSKLAGQYDPEMMRYVKRVIAGKGQITVEFKCKAKVTVG